MEMETKLRPVPDGSEKDEKIVKYCQTGIGVNRRVLAVAADITYLPTCTPTERGKKKVNRRVLAVAAVL